MEVQRIDERRLVSEHNGGHFVVFIYTDDGTPQTSSSVTSWAVDSLLITDAALSEVLRWLTENLPTDACWSLGVVREPAEPSPETAMDVLWIAGADVLTLEAQKPDRFQRAVDRIRRFWSEPVPLP